MRVRPAIIITAIVVGFSPGSGVRAEPDISDEQIAAEHHLLSPLASALKARLDVVKSAKSKTTKEQLAEIAAFYDGRHFEPIWTVDGMATDRALDLAQAIAGAERDALDPADYPLLDLASPGSGDLSAAVEAELAMTLAAVRYSTHLAAGRVRPRSLSRHVTPNPRKPEVGAILERLSSSKDIRASLRYFEPVHEQYWLLKNKLAELVAETDKADQPEVPGGKALRYGNRGPRVAILRRRLGVTVSGDDDRQLFDKTLSDAVKTFQRENGLKPDGIVGRGTLGVLNRDSRQSLVALMITNIERWRWMPRDLGDFHVAVNIPEYRVRVVSSGETKHATRVIVGKRSNPTPVFSDEIEHIIVNPYWNVPTSILSNEMLPDIMIDPSGFFYRNGYELLARVEGGGRMVFIDPEWIDWWTIDPKSVLVRQPPGRSNALGRIKFMFPNRHAVYLHDTPTKNLFERTLRAFSHGCVRVQDPMAFADALLINEPDWDSGRLKRLFGDEERKVGLTRHIPVHLTYFTATVKEDGSVETFPDIYGYDHAIRKSTGYRS